MDSVRARRVSIFLHFTQAELEKLGEAVEVWIGEGIEDDAEMLAMNSELQEALECRRALDSRDE